MQLLVVLLEVLLTCSVASLSPNSFSDSVGREDSDGRDWRDEEEDKEDKDD